MRDKCSPKNGFVLIYITYDKNLAKALTVFILFCFGAPSQVALIQFVRPLRFFLVILRTLLNGKRLMKLLVFCVLLTISINAEAYLDPGTGSMMLQVILGGIAAIGVAVKLYWHKLRVLFGASKKEVEDESA